MTAAPLDIALAATARGWYVFPVIPGTKRPAVKWHDAATTDVEQVATWFAGDHASALVGIHAGKSQLVVVDVDRKNGKDGDANLRSAGLSPDDYETLAMQTPSGGYHMYYAAPEGVPLTIAQNHPVDAVDIRSGNGYVVAYEPAPTGTPLAPAPEWSLKRANEHREDAAPGATLAAWLDRASDGKPTKAVRAAQGAVTHAISHDEVLKPIGDLIALGGESGARGAYFAARALYVEGRPDRAPEWDAAAAGSVRRLGIPPVTLDIPKAERKEIARRNEPDAVAAASAARRSGMRFADDASLSEEVESVLRNRWAYLMNVGVLRYTGKVWERSEKLALEEACRTVLQGIVSQELERAKLIKDERARKDRMSAWSSYLNASRIGSIGKLAMGIMGERTLDLDAHPDLLNVQNGVVDLRTGKLLPHDPAYMFTKIAGAEYHPGTRSKLWKRALEAFESKGTRRYMQVRFGQAATGYPSDDAKAPFLHGSGSNGKSVILDGVDSALGDYAMMIDKSLLIGNPNAHPTMFMDLKGTRFAYFEELPQGGVLNMERIKSLLGTRKIKGRYMGQDFQEFVATHSLMGTTNHTPVVADTDDGAWRRLLLVSFPWKYVTGNHVAKPGTRERRGDPRLKAAFEKPDPAVLSWIVEGAMRWYANDRVMLDPPADVLRSTRDWREDADQVLAFAGARLIIDEGHAVPVSEFYEQFRDFLKSRGRNEWSDETIRDRMFEHAGLPGVAKRKVRGGATWRWSMPTPPGFRTVPHTEPKGPTWAYVNVRFRQETDLDEDDLVFMNITARLEGKA